MIRELGFDPDNLSKADLERITDLAESGNIAEILNSCPPNQPSSELVTEGSEELNKENTIPNSPIIRE